MLQARKYMFAVIGSVKLAGAAVNIDDYLDIALSCSALYGNTIVKPCRSNRGGAA